MPLPSGRLRIVFLHLELGIGGAERLVLAAARHLRQSGHDVVVYTTRFDPDRALSTADGLDVRVRVSWIPAHVSERGRAAAGIARMAVLALAAATSGPCDLLFCDQVPQIVPLLKRLTAVPVIFYCHFPDQALAMPGGWLSRAYRTPIDALERSGMQRADRVLVNSRFTERAVRQLFGQELPLHLLQPSVSVDARPVDGPDAAVAPMILSLNRFAPSKQLPLAIDAFLEARRQLPPLLAARLRMVVAGGYDARRADDRSALAAVRRCVEDAALGQAVEVRTSCTDAERDTLFAECRCVLYTAPEEHFGLVPLEAAAAGRPVVGIGQGGLLETVIDERTGLLCEAEPVSLGKALARLVLDGDEASRMGAAGRALVQDRFSSERFGRELDAIVAGLMAR